MASAPPRPYLAAPVELDILRAELRLAVADLLDHSLPHAAKFAAELAAALPRPQRRPQAERSSPVASTSATTLEHHLAPPAPAASPHVHFRTSTPVKATTPSHTSTPATRPGARWSELGSHASPHRPRPHPRDSLGSVFSLGAAPSSPAAPFAAATGEGPSTAAGEANDDLDQDMLTGNGSTDDAAGAAADLPRAQAGWRACDDDEEDLRALAHAYWRNHELLRAAHVLRDCTGPKARWMRCYARYLVRLEALPSPGQETNKSSRQAGEKRMQEEAGELLGVKDRPKQNPFTQELLDELASYEPGFVDSDGYLLYLCV